MSSEGQLTADSSEQSPIPSVPDETVKIAYVGGGAREWTPKLISDLALTTDIRGEVALFDLDYEAAQRNADFGNWVQARDDAVGDWTYNAVEERADALEGADFVILSTQFNPAETFVHDLRIPRDYGIYGAVGATIGPGGIMRAMRTVPVYEEFGAAVEEHCPDAWVFNYTNPLTWATRALYEAYPDINAIGLCHEVFHAQDMLADLVEQYMDVGDVDRDEVEINVKGINHYTWVDEARWHGVDLFDLVDHHLEQEDAEREFTPAELDGVTPFVDNNQVTWELYRRFGILPAAGDRHLVEYGPWFIQGEMPADLNRWGVKRTTADFRAKHWNPAESDQTTDVQAWMDGDATFELEGSGEVAVEMMETLTVGGTMKTNVNLPNTGQMADVEEGAVVETNAILTADSVRPVTAGALPRGVRTQIQTHVHTHETVIEAADDGDVDLAFRAFLNDPQVKTLQTETARELLAELIAAERDYLPDWELAGSSVLAESDAFDA
jgi:alpha-galactosidase/6-phospho-beta-glucosidase family protein